MKTSLDCLPCYIQQALRVVRLQGENEATQKEVLLEVCRLLPTLDLERTPPENAISIYKAIAAITNCADPYQAIKKYENCKAREVAFTLRDGVMSAEKPLHEAVRLAIAGNIIDYGVTDRFDIEAMFTQCRSIPLAIDDRDVFLLAVDNLRPGAKVLYLADNCGEIVYDTLVIELLSAAGLNVTIAVKEFPIINDALIEDALDAGVGAYATIITNGTGCPGTPLQHCSPRFTSLFYDADMVISKGQGNFETLSEVDRDVFFFLTVKCKMVGKHLAEISGTDQSLPGNGEMVVYHLSTK